MKVTNWRKKLTASIVAAGIWVPGLAQAANINVPDGDFGTYSVPSRGYAYAADPLGAYRPTSPWVDDLSHNSGNYIQDNGSSNWLYNTAYATTNNRATPRSDSQAMHGLARYSAQVLTGLGSTFEAGQTYTLKVWAQDDRPTPLVPPNTSQFPTGVFMYLFDGSAPFDDATALAKITHEGSAINDRPPSMTAADSKNNWTELTLSYTPTGGAIGKPIGVGFFVRRGTAIDDVSLSSVPEPTSIILVGLSGLTLLGLARRR